MRKLFSYVAALALCSTAAMAQDADNPFMSFVPANNTELTSLNTTVTITPNDLALMAAPEATGVLVQPISGYGFTQDAKEPVYYPLVGGTATVNLTDASWGVPYFEEYYLQLIVVLADAQENPIESELLEDYVMGMGGYTCPDNAPVSLVKYSPDNTWNGVSFDRAYENGVFSLYYTKEVKTENVLGTILYYGEDGSAIYDEPIEITSITQGWSEMDGLYVVSFPYADSGLDADELSKIVINITGVSAGNETIVLTNSANAPQRVVKKGIAAGLATSSDPADVYTAQGTLVKSNATDLSGLLPGLYIVNGKKVVVK